MAGTQAVEAIRIAEGRTTIEASGHESEADRAEMDSRPPAPDAESTEFSISTDEMERRGRAYTTLILSLQAGITVSSVDYLFSAPTIVLPSLLGLAVMLVLSRLAFRRFFQRFSQARVILNDSHVERTRGESSEKYLFKDVVGVRTKRNRNGGIREITVRFGDGRRFSVNGLEGFEQFEKELRSRVPAGVVPAEVKEPIDYDHPLFYVVFGLVMGLATTTVIRLLATLSEKGLKWTNFGIAGYAFIMGAFFLLGRPIAQRYGAKSRVADLLFGLLAMLAGVLLAEHTLISR